MGRGLRLGLRSAWPGPVTLEVSVPCLSSGLTVPLHGPPHTETWLALEGSLVPSIYGEFAEVSTWSPECWPSLPPAPPFSELFSQPTPQSNPRSKPFTPFPTLRLCSLSHEDLACSSNLSVLAGAHTSEAVTRGYWRGRSLSLTLHLMGLVSQAVMHQSPHTRSLWTLPPARTMLLRLLPLWLWYLVPPCLYWGTE